MNKLGKAVENKLSAPSNDEVPLTSLVDNDLIEALNDKGMFCILY